MTDVTVDVLNRKLENNKEQSKNFLGYLGWQHMDQREFNADHIYMISPPVPTYSSKVFRKRLRKVLKKIWGRPKKTLP